MESEAKEVPAEMCSEPKKAKLAISTWSLHRAFESGTVDAVSFPDICAERFGVSAFEFVQGHLRDEPGFFSKVRGAVQDSGGEVACLAIENDFAPADPEKFPEEIESVRRWIQLAGFLEAQAVRVNTGGHKAKNAALAVASVVRSLQELVPDAETQQIPLCIENHWGLSSDPDVILEIIDKVGSEWVATCPDFGNFPDKVDRYEALAKLMPRAKHLHAKSLAFDAGGNETGLDYGRILQIVEDARYRRYLSVEFEGDGDEFEGVSKTVALIRRHMPMA
jgi:sugar phosphate isomerase/epimerase